MFSLFKQAPSVYELNMKSDLICSCPTLYGGEFCTDYTLITVIGVFSFMLVIFITLGMVFKLHSQRGDKR